MACYNTSSYYLQHTAPNASAITPQRWKNKSYLCHWTTERVKTQEYRKRYKQSARYKTLILQGQIFVTCRLHRLDVTSYISTWYALWHAHSELCKLTLPHEFPAKAFFWLPHYSVSIWANSGERCILRSVVQIYQIDPAGDRVVLAG